MATNSNELSGQVLGTYTLQHLLGRGGMGVVYLARQSRPRRTVAVKVLVPGMHADPGARTEFLARFRREADAIAALDHINIMPIYEYGEQGEMAFLVMPFVTGGTLRTLLEKKGILPLQDVVPIVEQAAAALDGAHAQGIVHRDLKPGNILFHADGRVLLADFGLAKVVRGSEDINGSDSLATLTSAGTIIGTPEYLSPEQSTGQPIGPYTDIYSLGIVLYQMLGGHVPFTGSSPVAIALKHTMETPPSLLKLNPTLPPEVETVVMKALAKRPEERFTSAGELAQAFHAAALKNPSIPDQRQATNVENIATVTVSNEQKPEKYRSADAARVSTEEHPQVPFPEKIFLEESEVPTEGRVHVNPTKEPALPNYQVQDHMNFEAPDLYGSETVEAPMPIAFEAPTPIVHKASHALGQNPIQQASPALARNPIQQASPVHVPPPESTPVKRSQTATYPSQKFTDRPPTPQRRGCQSMSMMLLGSLLTLVVVVGGFITYLTLIQRNTSTSTPITQKAQATATAIKAHAQPFTAPAALVSPVGKVLYGTALPGPQCDTQGGQWVKQTGINITCDTKGGWTQLTNTGGNIAGIFLNKLSGNQDIPDSYALQVQVNTSSLTQGQFGIFYRNQPGTPTGAFSFLVNSDGTWTATSYDNQSGKPFQFTHLPVQAKMDQTVTLDVTVQETTYTFYVNGIKQGYIASPRYSAGNLGLVVDTGTAVSFKNMVIYAD